ncbi:MAG: hypothetical protein IPK74_24340 [Deltaproteobacteria bacterium]|nr:hypothetical protein [Deltaproteobacteria bacterium]
MSLVLALVLWLGDVRVRSDVVDDEATRRALTVRAGASADAWSIDVDDGSAPSEVRATLRHRGGREVQRSFVLASATTEERSRELAAALALVIEQQAPIDAAPPTASLQTAVRDPIGWLAVGARLGAGRPADVDGGATLRGGARWRYVQVVGSWASVHSRRDRLAVDGVRVGGGAAFGGSVGPWWIGGQVLPQLQWLFVRDRGRARGVTATTELAALAQLRTHGVWLGLRAGLELATPPVRLLGADDALRFGRARFVLGVEIGLQLPPERRASKAPRGRRSAAWTPAPPRSRT